MKYIYAPLDLTDEEFHVYILMYKKCFFKTMELKYTYNQIIVDSNPIFKLTERKIRTIISNFIKNGYLKIILKGKKGSPTVYKIIKIEELKRQESDINTTPMRQESDMNKLGMPKVVADERQESDINTTPMRRESDNPINDKDKDKDNDKEKDIKPYVEIINYLNDVSGNSYRTSTKKTQTLIKARFNEKFTLEDFKKVIDIKYNTWKGTEWEKYLRPETLFGTKFESYLNEISSNDKKKNDYEKNKKSKYGW